MKPLHLLIGGVLFVTGLGVGAVFTADPGPRAHDDGDPELTVELANGSTRSYTLGEAVAHIERLEFAADRRRERRREPELDSAGDDADGPPRAAAEDDVRPQPLFHPDGRRYTPSELIELARSSEDVALRRQAIRALRWVDTDQARAAIQELVLDATTPAELRAVAAHALARPPHRDQLPEELVALLAKEEDPAVRRELAIGVASMRVRGEWMSEISELLGKELDPSVREPLLQAVARASRDPAARAELIDLATDTSASLDERQMAVAALVRGRPDEALIERISTLLGDPDPVVRRDAVRILMGDRSLDATTFGKALTDQDADVRATGLRFGLRSLEQLSRAKDDESKSQYARAVNVAVQAATGDPDPEVRRAGMVQVGQFPKAQREQVLEAGRNDPDLHVRLSAFAWSPEPERRAATGDFLGGLESNDPSLRNFAYGQLKRLYGVDVPYNGAWNSDARARAVLEIRNRIASQ